MRDEKDPQQIGYRVSDSPPPEVPEIRTSRPVDLSEFQEDLLIKVEQVIIDHRDLCVSVNSFFDQFGLKRG
jgi:hypothetical protein